MTNREAPGVGPTGFHSGGEEGERRRGGKGLLQVSGSHSGLEKLKSECRENDVRCI